MFVRIGNEVECNENIVSVENTDSRPLKFNAYPNPATDLATIELPYLWGKETIVRLADTTGRKLDAVYTIENSKLYLKRSSMSSGTYALTIMNGNKWGSVLVVFD